MGSRIVSVKLVEGRDDCVGADCGCAMFGRQLVDVSVRVLVEDAVGDRSDGLTA